MGLEKRVVEHLKDEEELLYKDYDDARPFLECAKSAILNMSAKYVPCVTPTIKYLHNWTADTCPPEKSGYE